LLTATDGLAAVRSCWGPETRDLFGVLLNATSPAEACLALDVLRGLVPERGLVSACNLREVIGELPSSPFAMRCDEETLARAAGLTRDIAVLGKVLTDGTELAVTTAGNLVLDVIVKRGSEKLYLSPIPVTHEFVNPAAIEAIVQSETLLDELIELVKAMGLVFNPKFYLSVEDFMMEHAAETISDLEELF
jgi:hypothetical protein